MLNSVLNIIDGFISLQLFIVTLSSACLVLFIRWSMSLYALLREVETTSQTHVFYYAKLVSWSQVNFELKYIANTTKQKTPADVGG